jgi:uncharacterized membrane protein YhhN
MSKYSTLAYWFVALSYLLTLILGNFPFAYIHKALPIALLFLLALKHLRGSNRKLIASALLCSATGDVLLALNLERSFIYGLGAFAIAQLLYAGCFLRWRAWRSRLIPAITVLFIYVLTMLILLIPAAGKLAVPVVIYLTVIMLMAISAVLADSPDNKILLGAILFVISDSLIATNKFLLPLAYEGLLIMSTYYGAQYFLLSGVITKDKQDAAA